MKLTFVNFCHFSHVTNHEGAWSNVDGNLLSDLPTSHCLVMWDFSGHEGLPVLLKNLWNVLDSRA